MAPSEQGVRILGEEMQSDMVICFLRQDLCPEHAHCANTDGTAGTCGQMHGAGTAVLVVYRSTGGTASVIHTSKKGISAEGLPGLSKASETLADKEFCRFNYY